jgi:hypothetical protein
MFVKLFLSSLREFCPASLPGNDGFPMGVPVVAVERLGADGYWVHSRYCAHNVSSQSPTRKRGCRSLAHASGSEKSALTNANTGMHPWILSLMKQPLQRLNVNRPSSLRAEYVAEKSCSVAMAEK